MDKLIITHTEFRLYWPARLIKLRQLLHQHNLELHIVEVAGRGDVHAFDGATRAHQFDNWHCLFPQHKIEDLTASQMRQALNEKFNQLQPQGIISSALAFPTGMTSVNWCRQNHRPVIIMDNARYQDVPRGPIVNWIKSRIYNNVDALLIPAQSHVDGFTPWHIDPAKMFFGLNVLDNDHFTAAAQAARNRMQELKRQIELPAPFFLGVGRQMPKKNWLTLIQAYHRYRAANPGHPWHLVLVGNGPEHQSYQQYVADKKIPDVHFRDFVPAEIMPHYYALASALVLPSFYGETWGLVVNEAMASELPVIVSQQCGCAHTLVKNDQNGWTFDPHSVDALTECLIKMASLSSSQHHAMSARSLEIISQWSLNRFAQGALEAWQAVSNRRVGFSNPIDRVLISLFKGRYRPN